VLRPAGHQQLFLEINSKQQQPAVPVKEGVNGTE